MKKLEDGDEADDNVYILHDKRCAISNYSRLGRWCDIW
jgi:hypothetical protein